MGEADEQGRGFAGGLVDAVGDDGVEVVFGIAGGEVDQAGDRRGAGLGGDGVRADVSEAFDDGDVVLCALGFGPGEELVEGEVVLGGEGEEAEVLGEEVGEKGGVGFGGDGCGVVGGVSGSLGCGVWGQVWARRSGHEGSVAGSGS